jgi:1-acyl-sn-glycerol-3-phosphate acyltransferase
MMTKIILISRGNQPVAKALLHALSQLSGHECFLEAGDENAAGLEVIYVYLPSAADSSGMLPDLREAEKVFGQTALLRSRAVVLISSALIYGTGPGRQSLVTEEYSAGSAGQDRIAKAWRTLEDLAGRTLRGTVRLTILRPVTVMPSNALLSRRLMSRIVLTLAGHAPVVQLLSVPDLARAILCAVEANREGAFNVSPDGVVPLHAAAKIAGTHRLALPHTVQRLTASPECLDYLRYSWTVSNRKAKQELGFCPQDSSAAALRAAHGPGRSPVAPEPQPEQTFDEFGMDTRYIDSFSRTLFKFLADYYWRIETRGLEHVPGQGRAVLVGMHRGFMPWDGVMALHQVVRKKKRYIRFLTHPGLFKFPFIANFMAKLGGVVACQDSADRVLERDELLGVFPEGVRGAFAVYRDAYKLLPFGRDSFVKLALRHRAPIIPFVTVGSAEIFPIFARIKSRRWTRYSDWPFLPISTFPFLPVPLPSKWHTQFLPPFRVDQQYSPEAAQDASVVKAISLEVRARMQRAVDDMVRRRRSIFFGSIFGAETGHDPE